MSRLARVFSACTISLIALGSLTGCGIGAPDTTQVPTVPTIGPVLHGRTMGGSAPLVGATIKMYSTGTATNCTVGSTGTCSATNGGYGVGTMIAEATTVGSAGQDSDSNGNFSFTNGYSCPGSQFAYLVSSGGNPGGGINLNQVGVAALGRCEDLYQAAASGYTSAPTVVFTNASGDTTGTGAAGTAIISNGFVISVTVTNPGTLYTLPPVVSFTGGGGTGAAATAVLGSGGTANQVASISITSGGVGYNGSFITINELTTVAAAYALGAFSNVSGTGASTVVQIGADSTNNAAEASSTNCSAVDGVTSPCSIGTTTAAAGLFHAFLNAANLVNVFTSSGTPSANSTTAKYAGTSAGAGVPAVPQQLINSIANSLTKLPTGHIPPWTTSAPTNTFSAMVNLAANPTLSGVTPTGSDCTSVTNVQCLFNVATSQTSVYSPALTSSTGINDYSIAIDYTGAGNDTVSGNGILVTTSGAGYTSAPTITISAPGGSGTTATATLSSSLGAGGAITGSSTYTITPGYGYFRCPTVVLHSNRNSSQRHIFECQRHHRQRWFVCLGACHHHYRLRRRDRNGSPWHWRYREHCS